MKKVFSRQQSCHPYFFWSIFLAILFLLFGQLSGGQLFGQLVWAQDPWPNLDPKVTFPLKLTDATGQEIILKTVPKRIISLAPSLTECLFSLGLSDEIIGVTTYCNYPPKAKEKEKIGNLLQYNSERIVSLAPQLIVATKEGNAEREVSRLRELGLTVFVLEIVEKIDHVYRDLSILGELTNRSKEAKQVAANMKQQIEEIQKRLEPLSNHDQPDSKRSLKISSRKKDYIQSLSPDSSPDSSSGSSPDSGSDSSSGSHSDSSPGSHSDSSPGLSPNSSHSSGVGSGLGLRKKPLCFWQLSVNPLMTVGKDTFADELLRLAGGRNLVESQVGYLLYSLEQVVVKNPEIILMIGMGEDLDNYRRIWEPFPHLIAKRAGAIYPVNPDLVNHASPRLIEGLRELTHLLHPEAFDHEQSTP